jgi:hypothetical protein
MKEATRDRHSLALQAGPLDRAAEELAGRASLEVAEQAEAG